MSSKKGCNNFNWRRKIRNNSFLPSLRAKKRDFYFSTKQSASSDKFVEPEESFAQWRYRSGKSSQNLYVGKWESITQLSPFAKGFRWPILNFVKKVLWWRECYVAHPNQCQRRPSNVVCVRKNSRQRPADTRPSPRPTHGALHLHLRRSRTEWQ